MFLAKDGGPLSKPLEWAARASRMPRPVQGVGVGVAGCGYRREEGEGGGREVEGEGEGRGEVVGRREGKVPIFEKP